MLLTPIYDPSKSYEENFTNGPFGAFRDAKIHEDVGPPRYTFLGHSLYLPFGIPSGPLLNSRYIKAAFEKGFDVLHYKTQRTGVFQVNDFPNILYVHPQGDLTVEKTKNSLVGDTNLPSSITQLSITNSFGIPSLGPDFWQEDMKKAVSYARAGQVLIASVVGTIREGMNEEAYFNDFATAAKLASETGVKIIEINLSCPNVASEGVVCYTREFVNKITQRSKEAIGNIHLLVKIGYYSLDQQELLEAIIEDISPFISGIAAINTLSAAVVTKKGEQALPGKNRLKSGICGASIKWAGLDMVQRLKTIREKKEMKFSIIGVGGVMVPEDYDEYRESGADLVQSATGAMWNPYLAQEVKAKSKK
jgi:dihydroorotate dehydrogenase (NAD+) catalytic subunit